ncbi:MAG: prepilin-type N-terminal cleavage/methylation domain-containing protein [Spirochaetota bacterium]
MKKNKGFTLIEILIVIAIIGLLSSVVLVGLGSFRARGRDARRIADLRSVQNSLEIYYVKNNSYPVVSNWTDLRNTLIGAGIGVSVVPNDPLSVSGPTYYYGYSSDKQSYVMSATLEDVNNPALKDDVDNTVYGINCADSVYCVQF